jgi:hypothetical protein
MLPERATGPISTSHYGWDTLFYYAPAVPSRPQHYCGGAPRRNLKTYPLSLRRQRSQRAAQSVAALRDAKALWQVQAALSRLLKDIPQAQHQALVAGPATAAQQRASVIL